MFLPPGLTPINIRDSPAECTRRVARAGEVAHIGKALHVPPSELDESSTLYLPIFGRYQRERKGTVVAVLLLARRAVGAPRHPGNQKPAAEYE